jgi:phage shock protein E
MTAHRLAALLLSMSSVMAAQAQGAAPPNPRIDYGAFAANVAAVAPLRESRLLSEEQFMRMAREPGTVVLDARSERMYARRHVIGAVNLSLPEFTDATLARVIPSKATRVLIYCNNNFIGAPECRWR